MVFFCALLALTVTAVLFVASAGVSLTKLLRIQLRPRPVLITTSLLHFNITADIHIHGEGNTLIFIASKWPVQSQPPENGCIL